MNTLLLREEAKRIRDDCPYTALLLLQAAAELERFQKAEYQQLEARYKYESECG